jgi:hypothetical protein
VFGIVICAACRVPLWHNWIGDLTPDGHGFLKATPRGVFDLAHDLSESQRNLLLATQHPTAEAIFSGKVENPAWRKKSFWFLIPLLGNASGTGDVVHRELRATRHKLEYSELADLTYKRHVIVVTLGHSSTWEFKKEGRFRRFFKEARFPSFQAIGLFLVG